MTVNLTSWNVGDLLTGPFRMWWKHGWRKWSCLGERRGKSKRTVWSELGDKKRQLAWVWETKDQKPGGRCTVRGMVWEQCPSRASGSHSGNWGGGPALKAQGSHRLTPGCDSPVPSSLARFYGQRTWGFSEAFVTHQVRCFSVRSGPNEFYVFFWYKLGWSTLRSKLCLPASRFQHS